MDKIIKAFRNKKLLITYLTAGDTSLAQTEKYVLTMAKSGADIIEIGIPFSDPVAEGVIIQNAMQRALSKNITMDDIFGTVANIRKQTDVPLIFMTYLNPLFFYGYEKFFKKCKENSINGIIVPDMPFEEWDEIKEYANKYAITIVTLVAPTSKDRISFLVKNAQGFIYLVSSLGVTGIRSELGSGVNRTICEIKKNSDIPIAVGFGISTLEQVGTISKLADGVIVGSAIVKIISENNSGTEKKLSDYILSMRKALANLQNS
ncbi:MAG: tryptophan synthase subunit alpha [Elusimicrobiota bacterium]|jgi:tryptophan synthase alpha chain|nr:tryptophan synthase subunit alpha [Elusimicrobiota bacterium]